MALDRNQIDLVANTKHFDHKHLSGASSTGGAGYLLQSGAGSASSTSVRVAYQQQRAGAALFSPLVAGGVTRLGACMLHPFQRDEQCNKCGPLAQTGVSSEPGGGPGTYAFRNPYFADELNMQQQQHQQPLRSPSTSNADADADNVRLAAHENSQQAARDAAPMPLGGELGGEHMHFIESHIANLHNRQVTSSVKELSSLNGDHQQHLIAVAPQVVDLTSDEQRARVRAHPQEGDLVAVDLSGHDIIGLGFDVCGGSGPRDQGIFVRAISAHGPASECGLVHAGDRIKSLNVSFECMTLQDALDILNCAAPYQMRLLLEKRMAGPGELNRMPGSSAVHRHQRDAAREQSGLRSKSRRVVVAPPPPLSPGVAASKSPLETTRDYLKQLTSKLRATGPYNAASESENESQRPAVSQQLGGLFGSAGAAAAPIGSRAARQQMKRLEPVTAINDTISYRVRETLPSASSSRQSSLLGAHESCAQSHHHQRPHELRVETTGANGAHRRLESCHFNEAFRPDDDDDDDEHDDEDEVEDEIVDVDNGDDDNQHHSPPSTRHACQPARLPANCDDDNEQADRHLFEYDDRQNKLMASGQTFNSTSISRLTM